MNEKYDTKEEYVESFEKIRIIHKELMILLTKKENFKEAINHLGHRLETSMNALNSFLNYFRVLQSILTDLESIYEWSEPAAIKKMDIEKIRQRLRLVMMSKSETLVDNLLMADRSAKNLIPLLQTELKNIPDLFNVMNYNSQTILEIFQFDPSDKSSLLFHVLSFLWQGETEKAQEKLDTMLDNIEFIKSTRERSVQQ